MWNYDKRVQKAIKKSRERHKRNGWEWTWADCPPVMPYTGWLIFILPLIYLGYTAYEGYLGPLLIFGLVAGGLVLMVLVGVLLEVIKFLPRLGDMGIRKALRMR